MSCDYGYINARLRAMKSFLLKEEDYHEAMRQDSLEGFTAFLSGRPSYANDFQEVSLEPLKSRGHEALKLNLCRIFRKIIKFCDGKPERLIGILLKSYDMHNLKAIIRGISGHKDKSEIISALIPAGQWGPEFLNRMSESKDLKELTDNIGGSIDNDFERGLALLIRNYTTDKQGDILGNTIDEFYFRQTFETLNDRDTNNGIILDYLRLKVDFLNIILALGKVFYGTGAGFIPGGRLNRNFFDNTRSLKSVEDFLKIFESSPYPWLASEGLDLYKRRQRLSSIERLLKRKIFYFCLSSSKRGDPLSISIALAFINFKENEINNLRLISQAVSFGMKRELIKEEVIYA